MDWPHDPDGEEGSEGRRQYGHAIIAKKVTEADFPLDREEFVAEYGDHPIRIDYETVVPLRAIFAHVDREEFGDFVEFHSAVGRAMREEGYWFYEGADQFTRSRA